MVEYPFPHSEVEQAREDQFFVKTHIAQMPLGACAWQGSRGENAHTDHYRATEHLLDRDRPREGRILASAIASRPNREAKNQVIYDDDSDQQQAGRSLTVGLRARIDAGAPAGGHRQGESRGEIRGRKPTGRAQAAEVNALKADGLRPV